MFSQCVLYCTATEVPAASQIYGEKGNTMTALMFGISIQLIHTTWILSQYSLLSFRATSTRRGLQMEVGIPQGTHQHASKFLYIRMDQMWCLLKQRLDVCYTECDEESPCAIWNCKWFDDTAAREKWIDCEHCHVWMHYQCAGINRSQESTFALNAKHNNYHSLN